MLISMNPLRLWCEQHLEGETNASPLLSPTESRQSPTTHLTAARRADAARSPDQRYCLDPAHRADKGDNGKTDLTYQDAAHGPVSWNHDG